MSFAGVERRLHELSQMHPRFRSVYDWALGHAVLVGVLLVALRAPIDAVGFVNLDTPLFAEAGRALLRGDLDVFTEQVQVGPLHLLYDGILAELAAVIGVPEQVTIVVFSEMLFIALLVLCVRALLAARGRTDPAVELFVACVGALLGLAWVVGTSSHPAEGLIPLAWVFAVLSVQTGLRYRAGALIGAAGVMKLWGVLGTPLLLVRRRGLDLLGAGAIVLIIMALAYAPFVIWGDVATFDFTWAVREISTLAFVWDPGTAVGWPQRILQGAAVGAVGAIGALLYGSRRDADWVLPLTLVLVRLLLDPTGFHYYWVAVGTLVVLGLSLRLPPRLSWMHVVTALFFYVTLIPFYLLRGLPLRLYFLVTCLSLLTWCFSVASRSVEASLTSLKQDAPLR